MEKSKNSINVEGRFFVLWRVEFFGKIYYINVINVEWRGEKSKKSINVQGGFLFCAGWNFPKSVSVTSRLLER